MLEKQVRLKPFLRAKSSHYLIFTSHSATDLLYKASLWLTAIKSHVKMCRFTILGYPWGCGVPESQEVSDVTTIELIRLVITSHHRCRSVTSKRTTRDCWQHSTGCRCWKPGVIITATTATVPYLRMGAEDERPDSYSMGAKLQGPACESRPADALLNGRSDSRNSSGWLM